MVKHLLQHRVLSHRASRRLGTTLPSALPGCPTAPQASAVLLRGGGFSGCGGHEPCWVSPTLGTPLARPRAPHQHLTHPKAADVSSTG